MKRKHTFSSIVKFTLFALTLTLGTIIFLNADETESLARANLADMAVERIVTTSDNDALYAEIAGDTQTEGFYRSVDNGRTWESLSDGPQTEVNVLSVDALDENVIYAGGLGGSMTTTRNLWRSLDGGQTWQQFHLNLPASADHVLPTVTALATDPMRPYGLYVGTDGQGVYRVDKNYPGYELIGGVSKYDIHVKSLVFGANSQLYALTTEGLLVTDGAEWQPVETPENFITLATAHGEPNTLYAGGASMGVYRSEDGGKNWAQMNEGLALTPGVALRVTALTIDPDDPEAVAVATAHGLGSELAPDAVYESRDGGEAWAKIDSLDSLATNLTLNDGVIHATTTNGLKRYDRENDTPEAISIVPPLETTSTNTSNALQTVALILVLVTIILIMAAPMGWLDDWREKSGSTK